MLHSVKIALIGVVRQIHPQGVSPSGRSLIYLHTRPTIATGILCNASIKDFSLFRAVDAVADADVDEGGDKVFSCAGFL